MNTKSKCVNVGTLVRKLIKMFTGILTKKLCHALLLNYERSNRGNLVAVLLL